MEGGEKIHLAILSYITTPLNYSLPSAAELLSLEVQMLAAFSNEVTKPHTPVQKSDATRKAPTSEE